MKLKMKIIRHCLSDLYNWHFNMLNFQSGFSQPANHTEVDLLNGVEMNLGEPRSIFSGVREKDNGFTLSGGIAHFSLNDTDLDPANIAGIGGFYCFKSGFNIGLDFFLWFGEKDFTGNRTTTSNNTVAEFTQTYANLFMLRFRQRVFSYLYPSIGGGIYGYGEIIGHTAMLSNDPDHVRFEKDFLAWSLGLDVHLTKRIMIGSQFVIVTKKDLDEHIGPGGNGFIFQISWIIPSSKI